jgi:DNA-binding response OmpR family regulator
LYLTLVRHSLCFAGVVETDRSRRRVDTAFGEVDVKRQLRRRTDGSRILVVEDNDDLRLLVTLTLDDAGYVVDGAIATEDAIRMLDTRSYDLILTDYSLPGESGLHVLSAAASRGIPAVMVTGDPDAPGIPDDAAVVRKPVDFDRLLPDLRTLLSNDEARVA